MERLNENSNDKIKVHSFRLTQWTATFGSTGEMRDSASRKVKNYVNFINDMMVLTF